MSELAFNMNGEPFEVPAAATGWRVRRMKHKGAPEVVYGRDGLPLVLPIESAVEDLRDAVGTAGRYRVDPVDGHRPIPNAPAGYVFVHDGDAPVALASTSMGLQTHSDNIVIEAMRMNSEIAKTVVDRFPQMLEAAAVLLQAADGAGLPMRPPMAIAESDQDDDDEGDEDDEEVVPPENGLDVNALVAQFVPLLIAGLRSGKMKLPGLASMLDWRKAKPTAEPAAKPVAEQTPEPGGLPPLEPAAMAHFLAIQSALTPDEATLARSVAAELAPAQLREWFDELSKLAVPDAVAKIRTLIASNGKTGGAS